MVCVGVVGTNITALVLSLSLAFDSVMWSKLSYSLWHRESAVIALFIIFLKKFMHRLLLYVHENLGKIQVWVNLLLNLYIYVLIILSWTLWNLQYGKGKSWKLLIYFFFWLCETVLKLVTKCTIKCYCSYYNLCLVRRISIYWQIFFFGVIFCWWVFFLCNQLLKIQNLLS